MKQYSIVEVFQLFKSKQLSPVEYAQDIIQSIKGDYYNAILAIDEDMILFKAKEAEQRYSKGIYLSQIDGIPIGIKDIIDTKGLYTTYGCDAYRDYVPKEDAFAVETLKNAGAITYLKTNTSQFALGPTGEFCLNGAVKNPHNSEYYSGGSSAGSAAAVTAGLLPAAIGTDSGGSIRMPSSLCGLIGMKPTYSLISNSGIMPVNASLDTVGPMTNDIMDNAVLLGILASFNNKDWRQSYTPSDNYVYRIGEGVEGAKVTVLTNLFIGSIDSEIKSGCIKSVDMLSMLDISVIEKQLPDLSVLYEAHQISMLAYANSIHSEDMEKHSELIYPQVMARLKRGEISSKLYVQLERKKRELIDILFAVLEDTECLIYPTTPITAYRIGRGDDKTIVGGNEITPSAMTALNTWIGSFSGMPCINIPVGKTELGLPYGLTLMGRPYDESNLYRIGYQLLRLLGK